MVIPYCRQIFSRSAFSASAVMVSRLKKGSSRMRRAGDGGVGGDRERASEPDPLALAARERDRVVVLEVSEAHLAKLLAGEGLALPAPHTHHSEPVSDVVE